MAAPTMDSGDGQDSGHDMNLIEDEDDEEGAGDEEQRQRQLLLEKELLLDRQLDQELGLGLDLDLEVPHHGSEADDEDHHEQVEPSVPQEEPEEPRPASYIDRSHFELFNLLDQPVWIFDIVRRCMWWGNKAAIELWSAESLEDLLARNFAEDMSDATKNRLDDYLLKFSQAETGTVKVTEQWVRFEIFLFLFTSLFVLFLC